MRPLRVALVFGAVLLAAVVWSDPTIQLTVDSLTPQGPYTPGQQVTVKGSIAFTGLPRPWGGGGRSTTTTAHSANVALEWIKTVDDSWPEVPELQSARGNMLVADGSGWTKSEQTHGGVSRIWSTNINPPARTRRTDPMNHDDTIAFEGSFTVPDECVAIRLRSQLENRTGSHWMVSWYYYDYKPLSLEVPGVEQIRVTCEREPYQRLTRTVVVSERTDKVTITGTALDPRRGPVHRAMITASGAGAMGQALTAEDGSYSIDLTLSEPNVITTRAATGNLQTESKTCDFRLNTEARLVEIKYTANAQGYKPTNGSIMMRVPPDTRTVWVSGAIVHRDDESVQLASEGRITEYHKIDRGTIKLQGPKGGNTFDFWFGSFTGYVVIADAGAGEVKKSRIILLEPKPNAQQAGTPGQQGSDTLSFSSSKRIMERIWDDADPTLRKNWMRLGFVMALMKDATSAETAISGPKNARTFLENWESGDAQKLMDNAIWTLQESVGMAQGKLIPSGPEDMAKLTKKLYNQIQGQGQEIPESPEGARAALKQMVIRLNQTWHAIQEVQ